MFSLRLICKETQLLKMSMFFVSASMLSCGTMTFSGSSQKLEDKTIEAKDVVSSEEENSEALVPGSSDLDAGNTSLPEAEEEEIIAEPPTIISGAYLACTNTGGSKNKLNCGFEDKFQVIDLSDHEAKFFWQNDQEDPVMLESILVKETKRYEVIFPDNIEANTKNLGAEISIFGASFSVYTKDFDTSSNLEPKVETGKDEDKIDQQETEKSQVKFIDLPLLNSCSDASQNPDNNVTTIRASDSLPQLNENSFLIIEADGDEEINLDLKDVQQIKGLCISSNSNSVINISAEVYINHVAIFSDSNGVINLNFLSDYFYNEVYGDTDSNSVLNIMGQLIDCDKVNVVEKSNAAVTCNNVAF